MKSRPGLFLCGLGLTFLFVLVRWNNFAAPLTRDEGEYAYAAQLLVHGRLPYENSFLQKPPMTAYTYALATLVAPDAFWLPKALAALFAAGATVLLGYVARLEFGAGVALPAMWLMTPMLILPPLKQSTANTETFLLLPFLAMLAVYVRCRHFQGWRHWLAGVFAAVTILYKYTAFPMLAFVFAAWMFEEWRDGQSLRAMAVNWLAMLTGGIAAALVILAPFLLHDGGRRLWECTVTFNRFYAVSTGFGLSGLKFMLGEFWKDWWFLFIAPFFLLCKRERRVGFWVLLFVIAWLVTAGSSYRHYYLPLVPFWALLTAVSLRDFSVWAAPKIRLSQMAVKVLLASVIIVLLCKPDAHSLFLPPGEYAIAKLSPYGTFLEAPVVAVRLAQLTTSQDSVFVAGSEPQIYCFAHRDCASRFDIMYPLTIPTPLAANFQTEAIRDLEQHPPAAVVLVRSPLSWLRQPGTPVNFLDFFQKMIQENYEVVGGCLDDGKSVQWQEPLAPENQARSPMILFKRRTP